MPPVIPYDFDPEVDDLPEGNGWDGWGETDSLASTSSGEDADDEGAGGAESDSDLDKDNTFMNPEPSQLGRHVCKRIEEMYVKRYEKSHTEYPHGPVYMPHLLTVLKERHPDLFREELRVTPFTFDRLLARIGNDPIFSNQSNNDQMPLADQVAITLFRFGHSGNGVRLTRVAAWSGYAKGTILLTTCQVMMAILRKEFMEEAVLPVTEDEKEVSKRWVEAHSCRAWRNDSPDKDFSYVLLCYYT
ncbi:hypothetical protein C8Q72DRAFT_890274 [Fomitopsis betulina]|nr:hypothetical protein C8Q72DRAFT_890274 [Fomitopsis betulina]